MEKIIIIVISLAIIVFFVSYLYFCKTEKIEFEYNTIIAEPYFTFWKVYGNSEYYQRMSYDEALWTFKQDNNMDSYFVQAGQELKIRVMKEGN